jgi:hypothetical protein
MHLRTRTSSLIVLVALVGASPITHAADGWRSLFNGKDFSGWETFVSYQPGSGNTTIRGVNNDPRKVFSVVNGMIRISGEEWGGLTSLEEFEDFHFKFETKWGQKRWPPRDNAKRDSGVLYFAVGPHGAQSDHWMRSHEFQIQEGDSGDYHSLDGALIDVHAVDAADGDWKFFRYVPDAALRKDIHDRVLKLGDHEKPRGEWDTMEVIADGKTLIHKVNGYEVFRATNSRQSVDGQIVALSRGKIQLQSEGAEVFYRNLFIRAKAE